MGTKKISEEGIGKEGQSAQEGNEGEKVRFQIDHNFGHKEEDNVDNDITLQCPLVSISLAENDDSKESPSYNTTSNKPDHKQKRKISKTSTENLISTLNRIMETKTNLLQMKKGVTCRLSLAALMSFEEQHQY